MLSSKMYCMKTCSVTENRPNKMVCVPDGNSKITCRTEETDNMAYHTESAGTNCNCRPKSLAICEEKNFVSKDESADALVIKETTESVQESNFGCKEQRCCCTEEEYKCFKNLLHTKGSEMCICCKEKITCLKDTDAGTCLYVKEYVSCTKEKKNRNKIVDQCNENNYACNRSKGGRKSGMCCGKNGEECACCNDKLTYEEGNDACSCCKDNEQYVYNSENVTTSVVKDKIFQQKQIMVTN